MLQSHGGKPTQVDGPPETELVDDSVDDRATGTQKEIQQMIRGLECFRNKFAITNSDALGKHMIRDFIMHGDGLLQNVTRMTLSPSHSAHDTNRLVVRCEHVLDTLIKQMPQLFEDTHVTMPILSPPVLEALSMEQIVADGNINYPTIEEVVCVHHVHSQTNYELSLAIRIILTDPVTTPRTMFGESNNELVTGRYNYKIITGATGHQVCNQVMARMFSGWGKTPCKNPMDWEQIEVNSETQRSLFGII